MAAGSPPGLDVAPIFIHEWERPTPWGGVPELNISLTFKEGLHVRLGRSRSGLNWRLHRNGHTHTLGLVQNTPHKFQFSYLVHASVSVVHVP